MKMTFEDLVSRLKTGKVVEFLEKGQPWPAGIQLHKDGERIRVWDTGNTTPDSWKRFNECYNNDEAETETYFLKMAELPKLFKRLKNPQFV